MKKISFLILLFFSINKTQAQSWSLVWSDEFSNSSIDTTNWVFEIGNGGWGNNELEYYTGHLTNATICNGNLLIIAKQESYGGSNYTSARMITKNLHSWTYGKIEARIKLPMGQGIWPAFWMLGQNIDTVSWPQCGEIDIMEHINNGINTYGTMHWDNNGHAMYGGDTLCNVTQYHVYSIEWDQNAIKWFLDGSKFWEGNIANGMNSTEEFHRPFYIILNLAVGGNWPGNPDGTTSFPDTMCIDYVRVYQNVSGTKNVLNMNNIMNIYPNSATDNITIESQQQELQIAINIEIYNIHGQPIKFLTTFCDKTSIDISSFPCGVYIVEVKTEKGVTVKKFIKE